jgi:hypothetical protein
MSHNIPLDRQRLVLARSSPSTARPASMCSTPHSAVSLPGFVRCCRVIASLRAGVQVPGAPLEVGQTWRNCAPERVGGDVVRL